jgi:predicted nucleotidyltransferase
MSILQAGLTPHAETIARRIVAEEQARRTHLVVALTGAHAFGFASPDSDLDLKAIHIAPTRDLLGLRGVTPTFDRLEVVEGVEIDYTSNELGMALQAMLRGNGNFLERVLGPHTFLEDTRLGDLATLARRSVSRRVHRHYRGFATGQLREFEKPEGGTAKKALYVLRTTLTGAHALRTGEIDPDLNHHLRAAGFDDAEALLEVKRSGERAPLPAALRERWTARLQDAFTVLDAALEASPLPEAPPEDVERDCEEWLVAVRLAARD